MFQKSPILLKTCDVSGFESASRIDGANGNSSARPFLADPALRSIRRIEAVPNAVLEAIGREWLSKDLQVLASIVSKYIGQIRVAGHENDLRGCIHASNLTDHFHATHSWHCQVR